MYFDLAGCLKKKEGGKYSLLVPMFNRKLLQEYKGVDFLKKLIIVRLTVVAILLLAIIVSTAGFSSGTAHAQATKALDCRTNYGNFWVGNVELQVDTATSDCWAVWAKATTYVANCDSSSHNANVDTWQTQNTAPGGSRSGETGRSGYITYPHNCSFYVVQTSNVWSGLSDPAYGCAWMDVQYLGTIDYNCVQM
jgi:hypothetical protein